MNNDGQTLRDGDRMFDVQNYGGRKKFKKLSESSFAGDEDEMMKMMMC